MTASVDFRKVLRQNVTMNVRIKGLRTWGLRVWVGVRLIRLAAWVIGIGVVVEPTPAEPPDWPPPPLERPKAALHVDEPGRVM